MVGIVQQEELEKLISEFKPYGINLTVIKNQIMNNTQNDFISGIGNTPLGKLRAASEII